VDSLRALLDTNVLVDYLNGVEAARAEIARYQEPLISSVTWMEVMVGAKPEEEARVRAFLSRFRLVEVGAEVSERAVEARRRLRIRLPDAIIWASAQVMGAILVTRNERDFPADSPGVRIPYRL
jgi:hypothetical protein